MNSDATPCLGGVEGGTPCLGRSEGGTPCLGGEVELIILEGVRVELG